VTTILAEFYGGPRDGDERALPALLPAWEVNAFSPTEYLKTGSLVAAKTVVTYDLELDEQGDPVRRGDVYRYLYRKPE